jgi:hypothetical protein
LGLNSASAQHLSKPFQTGPPTRNRLTRNRSNPLQKTSKLGLMLSPAVWAGSGVWTRNRTDPTRCPVLMITFNLKYLTIHLLQQTKVRSTYCSESLFHLWENTTTQVWHNLKLVYFYSKDIWNLCIFTDRYNPCPKDIY